MPTLVQFGAGNIGRGFIAPLFTAAGWEVVFVEVAPALVAALAARGGYRVHASDEHGTATTVVGGVRVVEGRDLEAVAAAVQGADLAATAVGLAVLPRLAAPLAVGVRRRDGRPLDVLVCENGLDAAAILAGAVAAQGARIGAVRTSIGRMIPPPAAGADPLDLVVEPYCHLPVERASFTGPVPMVADLHPEDDFDAVIRRKLYLHNLTHACLAYAGHLRGLPTIAACMADAQLADHACAAGMEAASALARARRGGLVEEIAYLNRLLQRYRNPLLQDPVARVARDPWRKLAGDDRLLGALGLCLAQGVAAPAITAAVLDACRYRPAADEPRAAEFLALQARGPLAQVAAVAGLAEADPRLAALRQQLASAQAA
jgi:mannitol-1-phosphate 5-dehydrogenase